MALPIGIVKSVEGIAIDVNAKGQEKVLKAGDVINIEDTIDTLGAASKVVLALSDGQEIVIGGNDGLFLDKSVYSTESFGNDAVASSEVLKNMLPGESVEAIQQALLNGEDVNNLATTAAGQATSSQLGTSGEAQYLHGGEESNIVSTILDSNINQTLNTTQITGNSVQYAAESIGDINDAPIAIDDKGVAAEEAYGAESQILPANGNVLGNDIDYNDAHNKLSIIGIDGNSVPASGDTVITGTYGTLTIHSDGSYTYVADNSNPTVNGLGKGENLQESFVYTVSDNNSINPKTDTGTLYVTISGANDAPVLTVHNLTVTEDGPSISGIASFTDVDLNDTHTFSVSSLNPGEGSVSIDPNTGVYTYKPEGDFQNLAVGETATVTFDITVADNNGATSTKPVVVTISGANDAPILSSEHLSGDATDDISSLNLTDSGTISFSDVDLSDTHTVSVTGDSSQLGTLSAVVSESPNSSDGTVDWVYSVPSSQTQYLGAGETKTETFNISVSDGHGGVSTQTLDITIVGTNDQPVVTDVDVNGSGFLNRFTGDSTSATYYNNGSNSYVGMDYATVPNDRVQRIDSTHAQFALDTRLPSGSEDWDGARIYLHKGEVLTLTSNSGSNDYYLGIDDSDHSNGTPDPVTGAFKWDVLALTTDAGQSVSLTAQSDGWYYIGTGAIDGPNSPYGLYDTTVTITGESGSIIYEVDTGLNTFTSTFPTAQDADANDALTYDIVDNTLSVTTSSAAVVTNLGVEVTDASTGAYKVVGDFNALATGETATVTFQYTANDGHGFDGTDGVNKSSISDPATVTLTITGTNDAPILSSLNTTGSITEDSQNPVLTESGIVSFADVDVSDTHSVSVINNSNDTLGTLTAVVNEDPNSDHGAIAWTYNVDNSAVQYLGIGETKIETFDILLSDGHGGVSTQTVDITITGTNDAPIAVATSGEFNEDQLSESIVPVKGSENLLTGVLDADTSDTNHFVSQVGNSDGSYQSVDALDGTLVKVSFDFINAQGNHESIFIPVRINSDGTYDVSQNELLDRIPQGVDAVGSFWYKVDDGHAQNHLSEGKEFTIHIHGQNDAPELNITSLDNTTGNNTNDIPVIVKLSGDRFNNETGDAPKFNILVDGHKINDNPLTIDQFRSYNIDSSLGSEPRDTSWEYVTFNVANDTSHVEIQYINDAWEGGHDVDGDGYSEDRNLIVDYINVGGKIVTDSSGDISVVGGSTLQAEDPTVSTYTVHNGVDESGRETMAWAGTMDFNVADVTASAISADAFHTETISENSIVNGSTMANVSLLDGAIDVDGLKSDMSIVKSDGTDFTDSFVVNLNANDADGNPLTLDVTINSDGTYSIAQNDALNALSAGTVAEGSFDFKIKDADGGLSNDQTFTVKIVGTNDQPIIQDVNISTALVSQNSADGNLGVFSGVFSETGEASPTFGGEQVSQTYNLGAEYAGKTVTINFDMKELGTWDGDGIWNHVHEANIEKFITFVNGEKVIDKVMGLDGLDGNSDDGGTIIAGQAGTHVQTDLHHFSVQATADANGDITLGFGSTLHEGLQNESYSIDNILIVSGQTIYEAVNGNTIYNGNLPIVTDADVGDLHTYSLVSGSEHVSRTDITDYSVSVDSDGHFTLNGDFNALAAGETATVTFQYTANDGHGFDGTDGVNASSISDPKTVTLTVIGTNDAPVVDLDGSSNTYRESFENLISHGWTVIQEPVFTGDHGIVWQTEGGHHGLEVQYGNIGGSTASDGNVHAELDSDQLVTMSTNIHISDDSATLTFDYKPRPGHESDSDMKVILGDSSFTIDSKGNITNDNPNYSINVDTNSDNGWMSVTVQASALVGGETVLTFMGLGNSDSFGAYLDNISLVNGSALGDNSYDATYVENGTPIAIVDSDISISDVDGNQIDNATITLTNAYEGDALHASHVMPAGIVAATSADGHVITLTGNASLSDYQDALKSITYENTSSNTNETNRVIEVVVNDGHDNSNTAISTIHVLSNTLVGGDGNDIFAYDGNPVDGGGGIDTLLFQNDTSVDLSQIENGSIKNMEKIDLTHADVSISNLNANDILDMTDGHNIIKIDGDAGDTVSSTNPSNWHQAASQTGVESGYTRYESIADDGTTHVFVDMKDAIVHTDF